MYAAWYEQQGPAEKVIHIGKMETPSPGPGEVLVRVHTSGINPSDTKRRNAYRGLPMGFSRIIPHSYGAGVIEAVGSSVTSSRVGERVWFILVYGIPVTARAQAITDLQTALEAGVLHPLIGARFSLREVVQAHQMIERRQYMGNVILDVTEQ